MCVLVSPRTFLVCRRNNISRFQSNISVFLLSDVECWLTGTHLEKNCLGPHFVSVVMTRAMKHASVSKQCLLDSSCFCPFDKILKS